MSEEDLSILDRAASGYRFVPLAQPGCFALAWLQTDGWRLQTHPDQEQMNKWIGYGMSVVVNTWVVELLMSTCVGGCTVRLERALVRLSESVVVVSVLESKKKRAEPDHAQANSQGCPEICWMVCRCHLVIALGI